MSTFAIYCARLTDEHVDSLRDLADRSKRMHRSLPKDHPARQASQELGSSLARLHFRGIPIGPLANALSVSHQAVRSRIVKSGWEPVPLSVDSLWADVATESSAGMLFVSDAGVHRRLHVHDAPPVGIPLRPLPALTNGALFADWLESSSGETHGDSSNATPLRSIGSVFVTDSLVDDYLVPL